MVEGGYTYNKVEWATSQAVNRYRSTTGRRFEIATASKSPFSLPMINFRHDELYDAKRLEFFRTMFPISLPSPDRPRQTQYWMSLSSRRSRRRLVAQRHSLCSGSDIIHHPTCYTPFVLLNWKWKWWRWRWMRVVASALPINKIGEIEIFICFRRRSTAKGSSGAGQSNRDKEKSINWFVVGSECFSADTFSLSLSLLPVTSYHTVLLIDEMKPSD